MSAVLFPESMALMKRIIETIMMEVIPPTREILPSEPVPSNIWHPRPWKERFPQLETVLRPTASPILDASKDISKSFSITLSSITCGIGSARIAGNNDPLLTAELNGSANVTSD